ncbi:MAG TPA: YMGG-like glycine zipper-containing protein [Longimicrobium sp.]|nr:YMGG-like glycine zipper-containing protein [Longimicrobium sp.]
MRVVKFAVILSTIVGTAACQRDAQPAPPQQAQLTWLDSLMTQPAQPVVAATAMELNQAPLAIPAAAPVAETKVAETKSTASTTRRSSSPRRSSRASTSRRSSSGSGTYASSGSGTYRQPRVVERKHTVRDAAIGAGAGAVIGAVAGGRKHRVRGAVVGGVLGGVAGAVIGNNVDKSRRIEY